MTILYSLPVPARPNSAVVLLSESIKATVDSVMFISLIYR